MPLFLHTIILRHRKENLKKCSLRGLEPREDMRFYTYPIDTLPDLSGYALLALDGPPLSEDDAHLGLFLIDGTWHYEKRMRKTVPPDVPVRSLPSHYTTAYPRKQTACSAPECGLASVEALYLAYRITGRDPSGLLDHYYWKQAFLENNATALC